MEDQKSSLLNISSEIGVLKTILLHRPGRELEQLIPQYLDEMLFEDIPYLAQMQVEHDNFAQTLRERGAEVLYFENLLADILEYDDVKQSVIKEVADNLGLTDSMLRGDISLLLSERSPKELAETLLSGLAKADVKQSGFEKRLSYYIKDDYPFYLDPLPNLYFARDYGTVIGDRLAVNSMKAKARRRESMLLQFIAKNHNRFKEAGQNLWHAYSEPESIEGGDILVLSESVVAIGCSARTSAEGIENLTARLFKDDQRINEVIVIQIPFARAYMHLDTVFTMVDRDKFTIFPGISDRVHVFSLTRAQGGGIKISRQDDLIRTLSRSLKVPSIQLIETGGGDAVTAEREQWNDSTNTLALAPGVVVTYRRNIVSNEILRKHGVEVVEIPGSELVRGRGGPRCMSMPLRRESVNC